MPTDDPHYRRLRDRLLADLERWPELIARAERGTRPPTQVEEGPDAYLVDVDLPGVLPADVELDAGGGRLVVVGRRRARRRAGTDRVARLELTLPPDVDAGAVDATLERGVLTVRLPRRTSVGPRRIPVSRSH